MEQPQRQAACAVDQAYHQRTPAAVSDAGRGDFGRHQALVANGEVGDRSGTGAILIARRKVQDQVADIRDAEALELLRRAGADTAHRGDVVVKAECAHRRELADRRDRRRFHAASRRCTGRTTCCTAGMAISRCCTRSRCSLSVTDNSSRTLDSSDECSSTVRLLIAAST